MRVTLDLDLPAPLHEDLLSAATEADCHPAVFAGECVESVLASRRLPSVRRGAQGARTRKPVSVEY